MLSMGAGASLTAGKAVPYGSMFAMSTAAERAQHIVDELNAIPDREDKLFHIMAIGKKAPALPDDLKLDKFKIEGCASDLWLVPELREDRAHFRADSNAFISKGVATILCTVYSGATPDEILALSPDFMAQAGVVGLLTPNRANGLASVAKQIHLYALVFKRSAGS